MGHFGTFWNYNDMLYLILNVTILISKHFSLIAIEKQRYMAAIASVSIWLKLLDWLRLFDNTAFFVALIRQTISGISWFLIIMLL